MSGSGKIRDSDLGTWNARKRKRATVGALSSRLKLESLKFAITYKKIYVLE